MADPFSSHPYQEMKPVNPLYYTCDICERRIPFKHKQSHEGGKPHRLIKDAIIRATKSDEPEGDFKENAPLVLDGTECHNCKQKGHQSRDCPNPKYDDRPCHNCKQVGHQSRDCPNPRVDDRECHNCKQTGHLSKECPNPRVVTCHNCDETGHMRLDCPKPKRPRDVATVKCNNCQQMGHYARGCTNEKVEQDTGGDFGGGFGDFGGGGFGGGDDFGGGGFGGGDAPAADGFGGGEAFGNPDPPATFEGATGGFDEW